MRFPMHAWGKGPRLLLQPGRKADFGPTVTMPIYSRSAEGSVLYYAIPPMRDEPGAETSFSGSFE